MAYDFLCSLQKKKEILRQELISIERAKKVTAPLEPLKLLGVDISFYSINITFNNLDGPFKSTLSHERLGAPLACPEET